MSRTYAHPQRFRRYRHTCSLNRMRERRAGRHRDEQALRDELRAPRDDDAWLEVLADFHEEHGRLSLAERLRRGRDGAF